MKTRVQENSKLGLSLSLGGPYLCRKLSRSWRPENILPCSIAKRASFFFHQTNAARFQGFHLKPFSSFFFFKKNKFTVFVSMHNWVDHVFCFGTNTGEWFAGEKREIIYLNRKKEKERTEMASQAAASAFNGSMKVLPFDL